VVTYEHETPLRLLQDNPKLATELYCDLLGQRPDRVLSEKALERLEALVKSDTNEERKMSFIDILEAQGEVRGELKGHAEMLLLILDQRGIAIDESDREQIDSCTDLGQLQYWATRAFQVDTAERLFG
jgi:hypothetical protein